MFWNPANPVCSTTHHMPPHHFAWGSLGLAILVPMVTMFLVGKPSPYSWPYLLITEWGADLISWGFKYMLYCLFFTLVWGKHISTYYCMWYWWMCGYQGRRCWQHLAVWTAKMQRSRRDSASKSLLKSLYRSLQFFSSSWRQEGRVQHNTGMSLDFIHDWFCCLAYINHLILPPSLVNHSLQCSS